MKKLKLFKKEWNLILVDNQFQAINYIISKIFI